MLAARIHPRISAPGECVGSAVEKQLTRVSDSAPRGGAGTLFATAPEVAVDFQFEAVEGENL